MTITKPSAPVIAGILAFLIGMGGTYGLIRHDYLANHPHTHFHANFAVFINGSRVDFSNSRYMEDIGSCTVGTLTTPEERTHLHNNVPDVVHVHDEHVTWGDFLRNIGFSVTNKVLITDAGTVYQAAETTGLAFILNGKAISDPSNRFIESNDRLLISYGTESDDQALQNLYLTVPASADEYNHKHDPASCKGHDEPGLIFWK